MDPTPSASVLLSLVWDLSTLVGHRPWTEDELNGNPPRVVRHQQIMALIRALGVGGDLPSFLKGEFLKDRPIESFEEVISLGRSYLSDIKDIDAFGEVFKRLMDYRMNAEALLQCNDGCLMTSEPYSITIRLTRRVNNDLKESLRPMDQVLSLLVDPIQRCLPREVLIREYGFPDVNLNDLDSDWM